MFSSLLNVGFFLNLSGYQFNNHVRGENKSLKMFEGVVQILFNLNSNIDRTSSLELSGKFQLGPIPSIPGENLIRSLQDLHDGAG